jgi:hypothetical protein
MDTERLARLIDAGMRLSGQVDTFVATFHVKEHHPEPLSECGDGACRSALKALLAWHLASGDEGHNWIAELGRRS